MKKLFVVLNIFFFLSATAQVDTAFEVSYLYQKSK